jgi:hypothetical protein
MGQIEAWHANLCSNTVEKIHSKLPWCAFHINSHAYL